MKELSKQQIKVLECIKSFIKENGYPPTLWDISLEMEFNSANAAHDHVKCLEKKGWISRKPRIARSIKILIKEPSE